MPSRKVSTSSHGHQPAEQREQQSGSEADASVDLLLYRGRWILPIRWCLRLKLFQAAGALSVANLMFVDPSSSTDVLVATSLVVCNVISHVVYLTSASQCRVGCVTEPNARGRAGLVA